MKLMATHNSELMEIASICAEIGKVIGSGTIMGAMPDQAVLSGAEIGKGYSMLSFGALWQICKIFFSGKGA